MQKWSNIHKIHFKSTHEGYPIIEPTELESLDMDLSEFEFPEPTYEDTVTADELESMLDDNSGPTDYGNKMELPSERKEEYKVEVSCKNETEQESLYYELVKRGLNVRTY